MNRRIQAGDKVRVIAEYPNMGWGEVTPECVGVLRTVHSDLSSNSSVTIDFPSQSDWGGYMDELELISDDEDDNVKVGTKDE